MGETKTMKTSMKNTVRLVLLALVAIFVWDLTCAIAFAQAVATNEVVVPGADSGQPLAIFTQLKPIEFLLIPAVTVLIQLLRKFIPKIPASWWPIVAPFIGATLDYAASKAGLWTGNVAIGAMLGGLGTWFHQLDKNTVDVLSNLLPSSSPPADPAKK
jgi:hypothetical protein